MNTRIIHRDTMIEYEKLLTDGRRFRWMGSNGIEYYSTMVGNCRNGDYRCMDEHNGKLSSGYIESITEIHMPDEILRIESFEEYKARRIALHEVAQTARMIEKQAYRKALAAVRALEFI